MSPCSKVAGLVDIEEALEKFQNGFFFHDL
jgi:hypothetical protein